MFEPLHMGLWALMCVERLKNNSSWKEPDISTPGGTFREIVWTGFWNDLKDVEIVDEFLRE